MSFTNDEMNLMCIYNTGTREGTLNALTAMREYLTAEETELRDMTDSVVEKLEQMSDADFEALGELPAGLWDRMNYDNVSRCYLLVCGADDQVHIQINSLRAQGAALLLSGALVDEVEGDTLVRFQAVLQPRDNMFGYAVSALSITG